MDFVTIDFETATADRTSACEIGLTFVCNKKISETRSWLIKPPQFPHFDHFNMMLHGIRPENVSKKPVLNEIWDEIRPLIDGQFLVAHNASFDFSVLRNTLDYYSLEYPEIDFSCSYMLSKSLWKGISSYDLGTLCRHKSIDLRPHRAGDDSKACAELTVKIFDEAGVESKGDIPDKLNSTIGRLYQNKYLPCEAKNLRRQEHLEQLYSDTTKHKPESIFYNRTVVFTGKLLSMVRDDAHDLVAGIGGIVQNSINRKTNILVVGQQDYRVVGEDGMSSKQEKAMKYVEEGVDIEILSEDDFLKNI